MANKTSPHILGTCTSLMGFCLLLITSLHVAEKTERTLIDEFTAIVALFFTISSILSFISIRTSNEDKEKKVESVAEFLFFIGMISILIILVFILFSFWFKKSAF